MAPGVLRTFAAAGVVGFAELVLLRKIHRSFRDGVVSVDLNFFSDMASNAGDSDLAFRRTELPGFYWTILVALTVLAVILASLGIVIARIGVS